MIFHYILVSFHLPIFFPACLYLCPLACLSAYLSVPSFQASMLIIWEIQGSQHTYSANWLFLLSLRLSVDNFISMSFQHKSKITKSFNWAKILFWIECIRFNLFIPYSIKVPSKLSCSLPTIVFVPSSTIVTPILIFRYLLF